MRKRLLILSLIFLVLALGLFVFSFHLYHYLTPEGVFSPILQESPAKPMITWLFAIWGVTFLFATVASFLCAWILVPGKRAKAKAAERTKTNV